MWTGTRSETESVIKKKNTSQQTKLKDHVVLQVNSTKHIKKNLHGSRSNSSKRLEEGTLKDVLWSHHYTDTKTRQVHHQKRNLQVNIFDEYRCEISKQRISRPNPTNIKQIIHHDQVRFTSRSQGWYNTRNQYNTPH